MMGLGGAVNAGSDRGGERGSSTQVGRGPGALRKREPDALKLAGQGQ